MRNHLRLLRDVSALVLMACTWRLWFAASDFPAVPFFRLLASVPRSVDSILSGVLVVALLVDAFVAASRIVRARVFAKSVRIEQCCDAMFVAMAVGLVLLNQHCLQPWMYHFLILTPLLWCQSSTSRLTDDEAGKLESNSSGLDDAFLRNAVLCLTASIYAWSAWSKLDAGFLQTHGPKFVGAICDVVGISTRFWTDRTWQIAAAMLPIGELIVGVGLLFQRTRRVSLWGSLLMHAVLILAVGPWGLNHRSGVLLWNGFFIVQNLVQLRAVRHASSGTRRFSLLVLAVAILFPLLRVVGCCDTWPAWAVYASSPARVLVQVRDDSIDRLPESLMPYVEARQFNDGWSWLRIDLWSLESTGTPIYPEDRFQLGVAISVAREENLRDSIRIIHEEESDRWSGNRERSEVLGESERGELSKRFLFGATPRLMLPGQLLADEAAAGHGPGDVQAVAP